jgi:hypothetical protein
MSCLFAAMTVQMIKRRSTDPKLAEDADRKLRQNMQNLAQLDKILPMAGWIYRRYSRILEREGEADEARNISISPPALTGDALAVPPILPSQRIPHQPPHMRTIKEEDPTIAQRTEAVEAQEDEWGHENVQLLHLEHSLTTPGALEHHLGDPNAGYAPAAPQERQQPQEQQQQIGGMMTDTSTMQPEIFDYHWFMENIGDIGNPFWWNQQQGVR